MLAVSSRDELLTVGPRFTGIPQGSETIARVVTHRSLPPDPPGRPEPRKSDSQSADMFGQHSLDEVLTVGPRFTGVPQGSLVVGRLATHMSLLPYPPDRLEYKNSARPSADMLGPASRAPLLTTDPRLTGVPQESETVGLVITHMSTPPSPPGRELG